MEQVKIDSEIDAEYDILLQFRSGKYLLCIRDLNIFSDGDDLQLTYDDLILKKNAIIEDFKKHGMLDELPEKNTGSFSAKNKSKHSQHANTLLSFTIKTVIVSLVFVVAISFVSSKFEKTAIKVSENISAIGKLKLGHKIEKELHRGAKRQLSPEKRSEIINNIRKIVAEYKPIVDEFKPLFR